jgi:hypothetical protein
MMLSDADESLTMILEIQDARIPVDLSKKQGPGINGVEREVAEAGLAAVAALRALNLGTDRIVSCGEIYAQRRLLVEAAKVLTAEQNAVVITGEVDASAPDDLLVGVPVIEALPIGRQLIVVGLSYQGRIACGPVADGYKAYRLSNPERKIHFVEKMLMTPGENYTSAPYMERVIALIESQKMYVIVSCLGRGDDG